MTYSYFGAFPIIRTAAIVGRDPRCAACGVPCIWEIVNDPDEGWINMGELGWLCDTCGLTAEQRAEQISREVREDAQ